MKVNASSLGRGIVRQTCETRPCLI